MQLCCTSLLPLAPMSSRGAVPIRDPQGHAYNAKDIHVRFLEPVAETHCDSKLRLILDSTVHWTESKITETERRKGSTGFIHSQKRDLCYFQLSFLDSLWHRVSCLSGG